MATWRRWAPLACLRRTVPSAAPLACRRRASSRPRGPAQDGTSSHRPASLRPTLCPGRPVRKWSGTRRRSPCGDTSIPRLRRLRRQNDAWPNVGEMSDLLRNSKGASSLDFLRLRNPYSGGQRLSLYNVNCRSLATRIGLLLIHRTWPCAVRFDVQTSRSEAVASNLLRTS